MLTNFIFAIVILHFIVGIGWLVYILSPREKDQLIDTNKEIGK